MINTFKWYLSKLCSKNQSKKALKKAGIEPLLGINNALLVGIIIYAVLLRCDEILTYKLEVRNFRLFESFVNRFDSAKSHKNVQKKAHHYKLTVKLLPLLPLYLLYALKLEKNSWKL